MATTGQVQPGTTGAGWQRFLWPWGVIGTAAVMFLSGTCCGGGVMFAVRGPAAIPGNGGGAAGNAVPITLKQFEAIKDRMSYAEIVHILGRQGTRTGIPNTDWVSFIWTNADGSNVECTFDGGDELRRYKQHGLK